MNRWAMHNPEAYEAGERFEDRERDRADVGRKASKEGVPAKGVLCSCGHTKTQHADYPVNGKPGQITHCHAAGCLCQKFEVAR